MLHLPQAKYIAGVGRIRSSSSCFLSLVLVLLLGPVAKNEHQRDTSPYSFCMRAGNRWHLVGSAIGGDDSHSCGVAAVANGVLVQIMLHQHQKIH